MRAEAPFRYEEPVRREEPAPVDYDEPVRHEEPAPREEAPARRYEEPARAERASRYEERPRRREAAGEGTPAVAAGDLAELSRKATEDLLRAMGFEAKVTAVAEGTRADVTVDVSDEDERLTEEKGETRQALQHLLNRFINRGEGSRYHLQLEINDFWQRREHELEEFARKLADDAISTGAETRTGYLSSQERRIVHMTLKTDSRVQTDSRGEDVKRYVVVTPAHLARSGEER